MLSVIQFAIVLNYAVIDFVLEHVLVIGDGKHFAFLPNQAENIAVQENPERIRDFLKKMSSNPRIAWMRLGLEFKNPWNFAAECISSRQGRDTLSGQNSDFDFIRCWLDKVRTWFEENPDADF